MADTVKKTRKTTAAEKPIGAPSGPLSAEAVAWLQEPLDGSLVKGRQQGRGKVSYVEGWHVIAEANRIFGFGNWDRQTVDLKCVNEVQRSIGKPPNTRPGFGVSYIARVTVTVRSGPYHVTRDGVGAGHGIDVDCGQAHESAIKEAETDATKRALSTFGWPFGLALYDKTRAHVSGADRPTEAVYTDEGVPEDVESADAFITEEQADIVRAAVKDAGVDLDKFLAWCKAESILRIRVEHFGKVMAVLNEKAIEAKAEKEGSE